MNSAYDLVIIGAGPAGMSAAQYGARANLKVVALEQTAPGGQALLIDILENYPGIAAGKAGFEFCEDLHQQAMGFGAEFLTAQARFVEKNEDLFNVVLEDGSSLDAPAVILAAGAHHRKLGISGEEEFFGRGVSYCATCDGPFFKNKKVFVVGGGDAACDEAFYLSRLTPHVIMVHRRDRFRAQKALVGRVMNNPNIEVRFNTIIKAIAGLRGREEEGLPHRVGAVVLEDAVDGVGTGESHEEEADAVFVFIGTEPQTSLVTGAGTLNARVDGSGYIVTDQKMESSIPGLFAAGDLRSGSFRQVVVAAGEGATAAHFASAYIDKIRGEAYWT